MPVVEDPSRDPTARLGVLRVAGLLALETTIAIVLHRLGELPVLAIDVADPAGWLATAPPADAVAAVGRVVALGLAFWALTSTLAYVLATVWGAPRAVRAAARVTLPAIRRYVARAATVCAVTGGLATPLHAVAQPPPPVVTAEQELPPPPGTAPPDTSGVPHPDRPTGAPPGTAGVPDPDRPGADDTDQHVVGSGDNLWTIARDVLPEPDRDVSAVAAYWVRVVATNRPHLRSGDPDLIHPGETIRLPPLG